MKNYEYNNNDLNSFKEYFYKSHGEVIKIIDQEYDLFNVFCLINPENFIKMYSDYLLNSKNKDQNWYL